MEQQLSFWQCFLAVVGNCDRGRRFISHTNQKYELHSARSEPSHLSQMHGASSLSVCNFALMDLNSDRII